MEYSVKVGGLYKICKSHKWKAEPFGLNVKTNKQVSLSVEEVCLVLAVSPHWDTPVSKLWARVLVGDEVWDIHSDFLEPING